MQSEIDLKQLRVLVTRPGEQGKELVNEINQFNGKAFYFPTIEISEIDKDAIKPILLDQYDWIIFISSNAVKYAVPHIQGEPKSIAAIGEGTVRALRNAGLPVTIYPEQKWNSEGLLALTPFHNVANKRIAIIKGEGGRELLASELRKQKAEVVEIPVYKRSLPRIDSHDEHFLQTNKIDVVTVTSVESLENLKTIFQKEWFYLKKIPLIVISPRIQKKAEAMGFETILLAEQVSNEAIITTLMGLRNTMTESQATEINTPREQTHQIDHLNNEKKHFPWKTVLILLGFLLLAAGMYALHVKQTKALARYQQEMDQQRLKFQQQINTMENGTNSLSDTLKTQQQDITALQQTQTGFNRNEWLILEAEFLTKLANDKLQFEQNIPQAILLLQSSDNQIKKLNDPNLLPVRKAIADDIANLQATNKVDIPGLYLRLSAVNDQLDKLPLLNKTPQNENQKNQATTQLTWWKRGLQETWESLKKIVVVRYHESGKPPLILPTEQSYLYMNLHFMMEKAMWGLLHQQQDVYKTSLQQLETWVKNYFVPESPVTKSVLTTLQELEAVPIKVDMPTVSTSLQSFQEYFAAHKP